MNRADEPRRYCVPMKVRREAGGEEHLESISLYLKPSQYKRLVKEILKKEAENDGKA